MTLNRENLLIKFGRIYQKYSSILTPFDKLIFNSVGLNQSNLKVLCLLSPPRAGSTITYQILNHYLQSIYLSNLWNLGYSTPFLSGLFTKNSTIVHKSSFRSEKGFVKGLYGEAEGLKFWEYWTGHGLNYNDDWNTTNAQYLKKVLNKLIPDNHCFITGFLGHVFCIKELKELFPNIIFIHLKRDLLSNVYSIYKASPKNWISTKVKPDSNLLTRYDEVVYQVKSIHRIIEESQENNLIEVSYEDFVSEPKKTIYRILTFANEKNVNINLDPTRSNSDLSFPYNIIQRDLNQHSEALFNSIKKF